jgi:hypothetical protein
MAYDSVQTWRVYSAEANVRQASHGSLDLCRTLIRDITRSPWWRLLRYRPQIKVLVGGHEENGLVASHSYPVGTEVMPDTWMIDIHPDRATERTVLHEMAHMIAPRFKRDSGGRIVALHHHGWLWMGSYVEMLRAFSRQEDPEPLLQVMTAYGLEAASPDQWRDAVTASLALEQRVADGLEEVFIQPTRHFGAAVQRARLRNGLTAARVARRVGVTAAVIHKVEGRGAPPDTLDRLALRVAVAAGMDPVAMREIHGINWEYRDDVDEMTRINPEWIALVKEMKAVGERLPPYWEA